MESSNYHAQEDASLPPSRTVEVNQDQQPDEDARNGHIIPSETLEKAMTDPNFSNHLDPNLVEEDSGGLGGGVIGSITTEKEAAEQWQKLEEEIDSLLIYTKAVRWPTIFQSLTEKRFLLRVTQFCFGLASFLDIGYMSIANSYDSVILEESGIPFFCFISITSMFVSISNMFLYTFPGFLGIPPHRHFRVSRVELSFDVLIFGLWIIATSQLAIYAQCPAQTVSLVNSIITYLNISSKYCPTLNVALGLSYATALLFFWQLLIGFKDQRKKDGSQKLGKHIMFARGNWRD